MSVYGKCNKYMYYMYAITALTTHVHKSTISTPTNHHLCFLWQPIQASPKRLTLYLPHQDVYCQSDLIQRYLCIVVTTYM